MYEIGNRSLFFLSITMGFIGMILVYQAGLQAKRVVPDFTLLGATYLELLVRDFAASIGALMLATRVGAGIAAEIGSMVVTEQVDALRMCAADPIDYLIVPRFLASIVMTTVLIVWARRRRVRRRRAHRVLRVRRPARSTFFNMQLVDVGDLVDRPHEVRRLRRGDPDRQRLLRPLDVRRLRGRRLGDDARGRQLVARGHHPQLLHLRRRRS